MMETIFSISNFLTMPFWLLMIFVPHWGWTKRIMSSLLVILPAALLYVILIAPNLGGTLTDLANLDLALVQTLLGSPEGATLGWAHFLAFDLFVGRWVYLDNLKTTRLSAWLVSPMLFFVLMLGPVGFTLYFVARSLRLRTTRTEIFA